MSRRSEPDHADIQGLVRFGFGRMTNARYDLLRVADRDAALAWLRSVADVVATAETRNPPPTHALQIAVTAPGLRALGVPESAIAGFSHEFRGGMAADHRSRQLGDVGGNAPSHWTWGRQGDEPHLLAMFFGEDGHFDDLVQRSTGDLWHDAFRVETLEVPQLDTVEPFGFADGISQPEVDWQLERRTPTTEMEYTNRLALGEVLLGYRNEYGKITDRPLLEPDASTARLLDAQDDPDRKDLARNGTYLVMRQLEQDVRTFWRFVTERSGGDSDAADRLAAAMVGRDRNGDPLVPTADRPDLGPPENQFTYDEDAQGTGCPFGAHIRRSNPRNFDLPERPTSLGKKLLMATGFGSQDFRSDLMSSVRFHRILRRGRRYGPPLSPEEALTASPSDEARRGLHFICLNANISRQFEFVQGAWLASTKFSGMTGESDPLLGNREPIPGCPVTGDFNISNEGAVRRRISGLPQFVTLRGGAYFFLPSLRALRYFAGDDTD